MTMFVNKFSNGKYANDLQLFAEPISEDNVKLMAEMITLKALRTAMQYDYKFASKLYHSFIQDLHHMHEPEHIVSDAYDYAQTVMCMLWQYQGRYLDEIIGTNKNGKPASIKYKCYREVDGSLTTYRRKLKKHKVVDIESDRNKYEEPTYSLEVDEIDYDKPDKIIKAIHLNDLEIKTVKCYMRGMTQSEISLELGINIPLVKYRRKRAREKYRQYIGDLI